MSINFRASGVRLPPPLLTSTLPASPPRSSVALSPRFTSFGASRRERERGAKRGLGVPIRPDLIPIGCPNLSRLRGSIGKSGVGEEEKRRGRKRDRDGGEYLLIETKERKIAVETSERTNVYVYIRVSLVSYRFEARDRKNVSIPTSESFSPSEIREGKKERKRENRLSRALMCRSGTLSQRCAIRYGRHTANGSNYIKQRDKPRTDKLYPPPESESAKRAVSIVRSVSIDRCVSIETFIFSPPDIFRLSVHREIASRTNRPATFYRASGNFRNKNFFISDGFSDRGRRIEKKSPPMLLAGETEIERLRGRSAPHETLIESIHGDSVGSEGEEKNHPFREIRMVNAAKRGSVPWVVIRWDTRARAQGVQELTHAYV